MAHDNNVLHTQSGNAEFHRGRNVTTVIRQWRYDIARVTADEKVSGRGLGNQPRIDARVGAGDECLEIERLPTRRKAPVWRVAAPVESESRPERFLSLLPLPPVMRMRIGLSAPLYVVLRDR